MYVRVVIVFIVCIVCHMYVRLQNAVHNVNSATYISLKLASSCVLLPNYIGRYLLGSNPTIMSFNRAALYNLQHNKSSAFCKQKFFIVLYLVYYNGSVVVVNAAVLGLAN
jgi:hypothetical protein